MNAISEYGDVFSYLESVERPVMVELFQSCKYSCLGVLRHLMPMGQQIVFRLLPIKQGVPLAWVSGFVREDSVTAMGVFKDAVRQMKSLKVVEMEGDQIKLNAEFRKQVMGSVCSIQAIERPWQVEGIEHYVRDKIVLDDDAHRKWNAILHYIVGSTEFESPGAHIVDLLVGMGLMRYGDAPREDEDLEESELDQSRQPQQRYLGRPKITRKGYEFMLRDISSQIWAFMLYYTKTAQNRSSVLQMLFKMSYCTPGMACAASTLDETQRKLLHDFDLFGLIQLDPTRGANNFYPTSLGVNVVFGQSREERMAAAARVVNMPGNGPVPSSKSNNKKKKVEDGKKSSGKTKDANGVSSDLFIIVETNFKVYAYTQSTLHLEMLKMFVEIECILPNLVVGVISRSSIRNAFKMGIMADQIIDFLLDNAHPLCEQRHRLVPDNITDQITLWEGERNRVVPKKGFMYDQFENRDLYHASIQHANRHNWLLFSTESGRNRYMVVKEEAHAHMRQFIQDFKAKNNIS